MFRAAVLLYSVLIFNNSPFQCLGGTLEDVSLLSNGTLQNESVSSEVFLMRIAVQRLRLEQERQSKVLNELMEERDIYIPVEKYCDQVAKPQMYFSSCAEATANSRRSGIYQLHFPCHNMQPFMVACDEETQGGAWTIIQKRLDGSIDFYRGWNDYKNGFGHVDGEYFIGLDRLHVLTAGLPQELLILMEDFEGERKHAKYEGFAIGSENQNYALNVLGKYSGNAGDSLSPQKNANFTTHDQDNDSYEKNCAVLYTGAWWYTKCHSSNLNGQYLHGAYNQSLYAKGVVWKSFRGHNYSLKLVQMMIRPKRS
ncbi:ficolin-1-like [Scaptodrosophila lebanonensis]|uniref:Ficolin-1-like n=1 Tax=Drosophila lebanonensis TaxID=7225 RepID=A0A6J2UIM2_DROLE|nr:ficolin-1-like [Scaptodrosophila lebanonensis]